MLKLSRNKKETVVTDPTKEETASFIRRTVSKQFAITEIITEINRILHVFSLLNLPALQRSLSVYTDANIISLRVRYKKLITMVKKNDNIQCLPHFRFFEAHEQCRTELKYIREASELLVNKILKNPKAYLRLEPEIIRQNISDYSFSIEQSRREKQLLILIREQVGYRRELNSELMSFSANISWVHDHNQMAKLSNFTLLIVMNIKTCFHRLLDRYSRCPDDTSRDAAITEMEPLAKFLARLVRGIRHYPIYYRCAKDNTAVKPSEQQRYALIMRFDSGGS